MDPISAFVLCVCIPVVSTCVVGMIAIIASNTTELIQQIQTK